MGFTLLLYNFILFFAIIFSYCAERSIGKWQRIFCRVMVFFTLFIPAALRYGIGTDYSSYEDIYNGNVYGLLEPGFVIIVNSFNSWGVSSFFFFAFMSFLTYLPICFWLKRKYYSWIVPLYVMFFYLQTYSIIRQALCVSFLIYAIQLMMMHKPYKALFWIIFSSMFHFSGIFLLPFLFLGKIRYNVPLVISVLLVLVVGIYKFDFISMIFSSSIYQESKYAGYESTAFGAETELGSGIGVLSSILFPFIFIIFSKEIVDKEKGYSFLIIFSVFFIVAQILSAKIHIFNRVFDTIRYLPIFLYPIFYKNVFFKYKTILVGILLLLTFILFEKSILVNNTAIGGGLGISPYVSIIDEK